mmetsp:Transcript_37049/g.47875  ORF Transcript_37049/g.47875 Transcript_37049/m.47875 type:complete len:161 (-) Transcript_37049:305-787(-)
MYLLIIKIRVGVPAHTSNTGEGMMRQTPSPLNTRPRPRIGLTWTITERDGRLYEFGGQEVGRSESGRVSRSKMVNDLHIYCPHTTSAWEGRPHGQGANIALDDTLQQHAERTSYGIWSEDATRGIDKPGPSNLVVHKRHMFVHEALMKAAPYHSRGFLSA